MNCEAAYVYMLSLQIFEGSSLRSVLLTEVSLPICDSKTTLNQSSAEPIRFKSNLKVKHDHKGIY